MNFFEHQRQARQSTKVLVFLFALAVLAIVAAVTALIAIVLPGASDPYAPQAQDFWVHYLSLFWFVAPVVAGVIALVSFFRVLNLSGGGDRVAQMLGAELLPLEPTELKDKQLRHVVEEMAIASGIPVPGIYVLRQDSGINAFAAGTSPGNAVVGVTQGALDQFTRDELQGVIAHEFSHIFNGDMNLNIKLMGVLGGILFISSAGHTLLRSMRYSRRRSSKDSSPAVILALGVGLLVIGWIGVFFGRWIKAAVSRQREFLADASAVQFTRNPDGLGGALARIKESTSAVHCKGVEDASHMFFGSVKSYLLFATHPPIEERLRRLNHVPTEKRAPRPQAAKETVTEAVQRVGRPGAEDLFRATVIIQGLSAAVSQRLHQPRPAMQMVLALLAQEGGHPEVLKKIDPEIVQAAAAIAEENRLALIDLAIPALKQLDPMHAAHLLQSLEVMVREDGKLHPFELAVLSILRRHIEGARGARRRQENLALKHIQDEAVHALKYLARAGHTGEPEARAAFSAGAVHLGLGEEAQRAGWESPLQDPLAVDRALTRLCELGPEDKQRLFEAIWTTAHHDHSLTVSEAQALRAFSEALEIPLPRI